MRYRFECMFGDAEKVFLEIFSEKKGKEYIPMTRDGESFVCELELLPSDAYKYIFVIDDNIRLIDPTAPFVIPTEDGQIFSCIAINANDEILTYDFEPSIFVKNFGFCSEMVEDGEVVYKRAFSKKDNRIYVRIEYSDVLGFHQSSILWYRPDGQFFSQSSGIVWSEEKKEDGIIEWHYVELTDQIPTGKWKIRFFINGLYLLEDYFIITPTTYGIEAGILKTSL
ncbi:hypothetical protein COB47_0755 [Caldicellulosiruptor obsidiansis OB47]|uniref:Glycoside hydrolase family 13 domain protein n=1 Tax=Caldicellulosiruptor obsidiansis (strain ATCC BAA-2073 / JCM 16842 / OB47) TaxID=608506 RepID=D9TJ85_CALOO|nr:hypothetical protein [Caldicellulosiruptor obsidiansis]ADL42067.1 hypothetical protein COB47_0755 [Caldicellulosiruptor obsidiansis OB47]